MTREDLRELQDGIIKILEAHIPIRGANDYKETFGSGIRFAIAMVKIQFAECEKILFPEKPTDIPPSLLAKQDFLKLPIDERRKILKKQAEEIAAYYEQNRDIDGMGGGEFEENK